LSPRSQAMQKRAAAIALLVLALLAIYLLAVHWWFTSPFLQAREDLIALRDQEFQLRSTAQLRPVVERRLNEVRAFEASNPEFLPEANFDLAASAIIQRLQSLVDDQAAGAACTLISRTPFRTGTQETYDRVTVKVRLRCSLEPMARVLYGLESGSPRLFVSEFAVTNRGQFAMRQGVPAGSIDANFDVYGFLRKQSEGAGP